jgi:hypothetical protein
LDGVDTAQPAAFVTLFADAAVTDTSIPGMTPAQAKTTVAALFAQESMFSLFIT